MMNYCLCLHTFFTIDRVPARSEWDASRSFGFHGDVQSSSPRKPEGTCHKILIYRPLLSAIPQSLACTISYRHTTTLLASLTIEQNNFPLKAMFHTCHLSGWLSVRMVCRCRGICAPRLPASWHRRLLGIKAQRAPRQLQIRYVVWITLWDHLCSA